MFLTLYINHGRTWMLLVQYNQNYFAVHFKMYLVHASHFFMWYFFLFVVILIMIHVVIAHVACVKVWLHLTCWHFKYYSLDDIYGVKTYLAALCTFWDGEKMLNSYQVTWPDQKLVILRERERERNILLSFYRGRQCMPGLTIQIVMLEYWRNIWILYVILI